MRGLFLLRPERGTVPITVLRASSLAKFLAGQSASVRRWVKESGFDASPETLLAVPGTDGSLARVLFGIGAGETPWTYAGLRDKLPGGSYAFDATLMPEAATRAALGWALGAYAFTRYKPRKDRPRALVWPKGVDRLHVERTAEATFLVRDLINTPANDMGPAELAAEARKLAKRHRARFSVVVGDALLRRNYPTIHAVGRASTRAPRLIDVRWGRAGDPKVTLIGKGVCFDTGGLDIKGSGNMLLMKKDMGGAAQILGLAGMIMGAKLRVRLRVLVPAVENSVSGNAMRPLDVIRTRKGLTVEIGNTDAEGRLILCDALAEADREQPDLIVDCATLTGAARVALGPDMPALFTNDDKVADALMAASRREGDPLWRLPLWPGYRATLDSKVADLNNISDGPFAGAITAALYLERFVSDKRAWVHLDMMGWNPTPRAGRPKGGEAQGMRALFRLIAERYAR
ncbi:MAG: leucyl aminopeptidase family protein [Alphaproteobacteria bacterium]